MVEVRPQRGRPAFAGAWSLAALALAALEFVTGAAPPAAARATTVPADSAWTLPFLPITRPGEPFAVSRLTRDYAPDPTPLLHGVEVTAVNLDQLDLHGYFPDWDIPEDTTGTRLLQQEPPPPKPALDEEEKKKLVPPEPGVHTGIPSPVAITGTLLGGLGLLVKVLTAIF